MVILGIERHNHLFGNIADHTSTFSTTLSLRERFGRLRSKIDMPIILPVRTEAAHSGPREKIPHGVAMVSSFVGKRWHRYETALKI